LGLPTPVEEPLWIERQFGQGEGQPLEQLGAWYRDRPAPTAFEPIYDTGESEWAVHLRAGQALAGLVELPEGNYLVVSHGNVISAVLHTVFGVLPAGRCLPVECGLAPGCYAHLRYQRATGRWGLLSFNDRAWSAAEGG
jgi:broad specificity phosphatase PhoE